MTIQKIYVHLLDGTDVWVPIDARQLQNAQVEILENKVYTETGTDELFEFFPGDVVELEELILSDGIKRQVAKKIIATGKWPGRKFNEFKYKAALSRLNIDKGTAQAYQEEIKRVKTEHAAGQIFYPTILETVNKLDSLIE